METKQHAVVDYIASLGVRYEPIFVPFSKSRHAKEVKKAEDLQINWKVRLSRAGRAFECDYSTGIGHLPMCRSPYRGGYTTDEWEAIKYACEHGHVSVGGSVVRVKGKPLAPPKVEEVLHCLLLDHSVLDHENFESWADEYGYDKDSRSAESVYKQCLAQALSFRQIFSDTEIEQMRSLTEDM